LITIFLTAGCFARACEGYHWREEEAHHGGRKKSERLMFSMTSNVGNRRVLFQFAVQYNKFIPLHGFA